MIETDADQLRIAVEHMHGGAAQLAQSVPVRETFDGKPVWEGMVHVFNLAGHSDPRLCLVLADRGEYEATVLRRAAYGPNQFTIGSGSSGDRCGA